MNEYCAFAVSLVTNHSVLTTSPLEFEIFTPTNLFGIELSIRNSAGLTSVNVSDPMPVSIFCVSTLILVTSSNLELVTEYTPGSNPTVLYGITLLPAVDSSLSVRFGPDISIVIFDDCFAWNTTYSPWATDLVSPSDIAFKINGIL